MLEGSTGNIEEPNSTELYILESPTGKACLPVWLYPWGSSLKVAGLGVS